ncbi:MAG: hypothetical protein ACI9FN_001790, partial [Saprospiraceae bacterium]
KDAVEQPLINAAIVPADRPHPDRKAEFFIASLLFIASILKVSFFKF